ncbi:serine/threonine-protein kinase [Nocardia stercoris]|uniref:Serine/threonine protein kinase n=1 Tax=Nocardia stercoris TaxID=2483361 RepID=A0A3M2L9B3_9NOCA|nr:serine/threonine-protein kinase [Nocardia stercoris]RMI33300.1 serine/threonine protein kinase [Nocardia stercoris]
MRPLAPDDPTVIGRYRLLGVLGAGGMGKVYLGRTIGGRTVAVKVVRAELAHDNEFRTRFRREVDAARRVGGRYTVPVLDADVDAPTPWLATGYVAGLSLRDAVDEYGPLPEPALHTLTAALAHALADIHRAGVVHRDLKPSNVLITVDGPRVIDFGIARAADQSVLTATGDVIGSPGYMCPEQITGAAPVGAAGDVFALGGVLTYAATGAGPFGEGDSLAMLWRVVQEEPRLDAVPAGLRPMIAACLAKEPAERPEPGELAARFPATDTVGWLPGPILEVVSRRAIELLDLESHPVDAPEPTATRQSPAWENTGAPGFPTAAPAFPVPAHPHTDRSAITAHHPGPAPAAPVTARRSRRKVLATAGAGIVALAAAGGLSALLAYNHGGGGSAATTTTTSVVVAATTGATVAGAPGAALPAAYVGTWTGTASDGLAAFDIELTLHAGQVGDELGTSSNTGQTMGDRCSRAETLTAVTGTAVTLRARLTGGVACMDNGQPSTVQLGTDGTANYSMTGPFGDIHGILHKR